MGKPEWKRPLWRSIDIERRIILKKEPKEVGCGLHLTQDRVQWQSDETTVMNFQVP
jgi:hypothetical protein